MALEDRDSVSLWNKGQFWLQSSTVRIRPPSRTKGRHACCLWEKNSGSLRVGFIFCNATYSLYRCHLAFFMVPCENWDSGNQCKFSLLLWLWLMKSFVFDSRISCLLPWDTVSGSFRVKSFFTGPLQFLTVPVAHSSLYTPFHLHWMSKWRNQYLKPRRDTQQRIPCLQVRSMFLGDSH